MKINKFLIIILSVVLLYACGTTKSTVTDSNQNNTSTVLKYPQTRKDLSVESNYHGTIIKDPYRWLEDDNSEETKAWVKAENEVTFAYLNKIPYRQILKQRLEKVWNFERYGVPFKEGNQYYYLKNDGLQNQSVLYSQETLDADSKVVLDPNTMSAAGVVALGGIFFNKKSDLMAITISEAGSDWQRAQVLDVSTGKMQSDTLRWLKFTGLAWHRKGFFYSRYPEPKKGDELKAKSASHMVYYHKMGTPQSEDDLIYSDKSHPDYNFYCSTSDDERWLVMSVAESTSGNQVYIKNLVQTNAKFAPVVTTFTNDFEFIDAIDGKLYFLTNHKAPNSRLIAIDPDKTGEPNWITVIPEGEDVLRSVQYIGGKFVVESLHNASSRMQIYNTSGKMEREVQLPTIGTVSGISGKPEDNQAFYAFTSFTYPTTIFELDIPTGSSKIFKAPKVDFKPNDFETKQIWYTSKDGTKVPMFVTHKKGLALDGKNPCLLYGYGGFNVSQVPAFSVSRAVMMEQGAVYVVANIRGGGEFGEKWHKAGTLGNKQNVFDDFIAAAEYLISAGYTSKEKLGIEGGSNGGLLVGACMTQRPDLFKVAFPRVGVLDMLRYDKFTIGRAWSTDYGLSERPDDFKYLIKYSPLHNIKKTAYPSTMVMTADHDDRVVPAHSFKFAATLQENQQGNNPTLIRIDTSAGHGAGKPTGKLIEEAADAMSFFFYNVGKDIK